MSEQFREACGSCGYPAGAGHSKDCQTNKPEQGKTEHSFSDLLAELEKAGFDKDKILDICVEENIIGHGGNATVYKIPNVHNYVMRVVQWNKDKKIDEDKIEEVKDEFPEINVGQAVAKVAERIYFLKKQNGIPAGAPAGKLRSENKIADPTYEEHLKMAAEMPQSAYDEFARTLMIVNARDHQFDPSKANNVLIDAQSGKFNLVDINKRRANSTYKNDIGDMVITLMDNSYAYRYKGSAPLEAYRKAILEKCIEAGKNASSPIPEAGQNSSLDYSFKLAGLERTKT